MRIVSFNTWCATQEQELRQFVELEAPHTDVFCFQEVTRSFHPQRLTTHGWFTNSIAILDELLPGFTCEYIKNVLAPTKEHDPIPNREFEFGMAIYSRIPILETGSTVVMDTYSSHSKHDDLSKGTRDILWVRVDSPTGPLTISTLHGFWTPDKRDNDHRLEQAERTRAFLAGMGSRTVLCGDFNIAADTESLRIMKGEWRELVTEFEIPTTRSRLYTRDDPHADYCIVSPDLTVESFSVPDTDASDHRPLFLELDV